MLTILPGTTTTLRTVCPSRCFCTAMGLGQRGSGLGTSSLRDAPAGTSMVPRSLPLTCTAR
jgi:hypothetical protein